LPGIKVESAGFGIAHGIVVVLNPEKIKLGTSNNGPHVVIWVRALWSTSNEPFFARVETLVPNEELAESLDHLDISLRAIYLD